MVYAQMTGSQSQDNAATSLEGAVTKLLAATREALTEKVATDLIRSGVVPRKWKDYFNTHDLFPIRNSMCEALGLSRIPDPNSTDRSLDRSWFHMFLEENSAEYVISIVLQGMNDRDNRKIEYEPAMEWFTAHSPAGWDPYDFAEEVVFDMETGDFTREAVVYMLTSLGVLQKLSLTRANDINLYLDDVLSKWSVFSEGDRVRARAAHGEVLVGSEGIVVAPGDLGTEEAAATVWVDFDSHGRIKIVAHELDLLRLPGAYRIGDQVVATKAWDDIKLGDQARVSGAATTTGDDSYKRVLIDIEARFNRINYIAMTQIDLVTLAGGFRSGDQVTVAVAQDNIQPGDPGVVVGPCSRDCLDAGLKVWVDFGLCRTNCIVTQLNLVPMASGLRIGDHVISTVDRILFENDKMVSDVQRGDQGVVVGPSYTVEQTAKVTVDFQGTKGRASFAGAELILMRLAGGFRVGDKVEIVSVRRNQCTVGGRKANIEKGECGVVVGGCNPKIDDGDARVFVEFGMKGRANCIVTDLKLVLLAGGFRVGDEVTGPPGVGTVVSGCGSQADNIDRVLVDFGAGGTTEQVASDLELVKLNGGYCIGDPVRSLIDSNDLKKRDKGVVIGPSTTLDDTAERVQVHFGPKLKVVNMAITQIERAKNQQNQEGAPAEEQPSRDTADLKKMSYMKLKKYLLGQGCTKEEVDRCSGKSDLLYLWENA